MVLAGSICLPFVSILPCLDRITELVLLDSQRGRHVFQRTGDALRLAEQMRGGAFGVLARGDVLGLELFQTSGAFLRDGVGLFSGLALYLGGALYRVPVLIDGFPSAAAALCAFRLCENAKKAMLASHLSAEPAGALLLRELGKSPLITAGLRLGEGSGAVAAMPLLDMALAVYRECYSFAEGGIAPYTPQ